MFAAGLDARCVSFYRAIYLSIYRQVFAAYASDRAFVSGSALDMAAEAMREALYTIICEGQMAHTQVVIHNALNEDVVGILFSRLRNPLDPRDALAFCYATPLLRKLTKALRKQLQADHEAAAGLGHKLEMNPQGALRDIKLEMNGIISTAESCKNLREAKSLRWHPARGMVLSCPTSRRWASLARCCQRSSPSASSGRQTSQLAARAGNCSPKGWASARCLNSPS